MSFFKRSIFIYHKRGAAISKNIVRANDISLDDVDFFCISSSKYFNTKCSD